MHRSHAPASLTLLLLVGGSCAVLQRQPESSMEGTLVPEIAASPAPVAPRALFPLTVTARVGGAWQPVGRVVAIENGGRTFLLQLDGSRRVDPGESLRLLVGDAPSRLLQAIGERAGCVEARPAPFPHTREYPDAWLDAGNSDDVS